MRSGKLSSRLSRIRENQKANDSPPSEARGPAMGERAAVRAEIDSVEGAGTALPGWRQTAENLFERTLLSPATNCRAELSPRFPLLFPREREALSRLGSFSGWKGRLVFFDLETTGLSHGAGTVAFMAAVGRMEEPGQFAVTQLLIDDYPGEPAFLSRFSELVGESPVLASFNGKGFDAQILQTRFLMNAMRPGFLSSVHLDLLYPARRLWKRELGNCRLGTLEAEIFNAPRVDDLPGSEAPDAWFEYLRGGSPERLLAVGEHNLEDVKTLCTLLFELDSRIDSGEGRAALIVALEMRSRRDYEGARAFLEPLARAGDPIAARLLAIDAEHRLDRLDMALDLATGLGDEKRAARIKEKIARREDPLF